MYKTPLLFLEMVTRAHHKMQVQEVARMLAGKEVFHLFVSPVYIAGFSFSFGAESSGGTDNNFSLF